MTAAVFSPPGLVPSLTRAWVSLYCIGMTSEARGVRRLEIESDLWEHFSDRAVEGASPAHVSVEAFSRMLRGVPSDIAWRFQAEGFQVNINFPVERFAGLVLLLLIVPFIAGAAISGYDTSRTEWPSEFARFADIPSWQRTTTSLLHGGVGILMIAGASQLMVMLRDRSSRLGALGSALLIAAGVLMLVNAAVYRALSGLADEFLSQADASLVSSARGFAIAVETLAMGNFMTTTSGILCLGFALAHLALVPRWTLILPGVGVVGAILWIVGPSFGDSAWIGIGVGWLAVALWLIVCGVWLLFGGGRRRPSLEGVPA